MAACANQVDGKCCLNCKAKVGRKTRVFIALPGASSDGLQLSVSEFKDRADGKYVFLGRNPPDSLAGSQELLDWRMQEIDKCDLLLVIAENGQLPRMVCVAIGVAIQLKKHILILSPVAKPMTDPCLGTHAEVACYQDFEEVGSLLAVAIRRALGDSPLPLYEQDRSDEVLSEPVGAVSGKLFGPPPAVLKSRASVDPK